MSDDHEFRIRPGRIRSTRAQQARPFVAQALAAAKKAGGGVSRSGSVTSGNRSRFGRGQRASIQANRLITSRTRGAVVKARVVRYSPRSAPLGTHLDYLRRDGVTRDGEKARLFGPETENADARAFAERCGDDRHHFRFIVSPDDAPEMADLKSFTRDLVGQMERDLGTKLDWVAVDHWNTEHPHVHLIVRGVRDDGQDLVISRDYIKEGMRDRARDLITQELGPRTDLDIRRGLESQIETERWTQLDRQLVRDAGKSGIIDLAPRTDRQPDEFHALKVGRLRTLEILGVAGQVGHSQWFIRPEAENVLRELGERGDIIKRMHRALTERGIERGSASYVLAGESLDVPVVGRLLERGLDDELKGTAYAVVDGVDGRTHHIKLPHLDAAGDSPPGSIVELRAYEDAQGQRRVALAVRSDLDIHAQVNATGATWLDRQAVAREPVALSEGGFGAEVQQALEHRAEHLIDEGLAERQGGRVVFARRLLNTLRQREVNLLGQKLAADTSDLDIHAQVNATGATWLDRQAVAREPVALSEGGFGAEVQQALEHRAEHLIDEGLAERQGGRVVFARRLLNTLRQREVNLLGQKLAADTGLPFNHAGGGEYVAGSYRQRFTLASGRFAMIDDGLGFQLVPWSPSLEKQIGRHVSGVARDDGGIDWDFGRKRGLGL